MAVIDSPRREPLPSLAALPTWLWRRAGRGARIATVALLLAAAAFAIALVPALRDEARERAEAVRAERAAARSELVRRLEAEQRPRRGRSRPAPTVPARAALMDELAGAIAADARARIRRGELDGRVRRVDCEPFPRSVGGTAPHETLESRRGRYSCLAVTSEFSGGVIGHTYRALVDFPSGRYAYCKVTGRSGPARDQLVTTPKACGG